MEFALATEVKYQFLNRDHSNSVATKKAFFLSGKLNLRSHLPLLHGHNLVSVEPSHLQVTSSWGSEFKNILHGYLTKKLDHFINKNKTVKRHSFLGTVTIRKLNWLDKFIPRRRCHIGSDSARSALSPCHRRRPRFRWRPCWHRDASGKGRERS